MDDYEEAMVAFSQGLATNPKENAMLTALVETMLKSSLKGEHDIRINKCLDTVNTNLFRHLKFNRICVAEECHGRKFIFINI